MQTELSAFKDLWDFFKTLGPAGAVAAYLAYKDLYKPWKYSRGGNGKNGNGSQTKFNPTEYVREGDFSGFSQSVRGFMEMYKQDKQEFKERYNQDQSRLEGWIDNLSERILTLERRR